MIYLERPSGLSKISRKLQEDGESNKHNHGSGHDNIVKKNLRVLVKLPLKMEGVCGHCGGCIRDPILMS